MRISVRKFQRHASEYLDKLPIVLTRYNKPVAKITHMFGSKRKKPNGEKKTCKHGFATGLCKFGCK